MTDLRMLVLFQELRLLKEFEKRDNALVKKLDDKREEKSDIVLKIADCRDKIASRKVEIEKLNPKQVSHIHINTHARARAHTHTHTVEIEKLNLKQVYHEWRCIRASVALGELSRCHALSLSLARSLSLGVLVHCLSYP